MVETFVAAVRRCSIVVRWLQRARQIYADEVAGGQGRGRRNVLFEAEAGGGDGAEDGERGAEMVDRRKGNGFSMVEEGQQRRVAEAVEWRGERFEG